MKKAIISQPIEEKTLEEILDTYNEAKKYLESKGYEVANIYIPQQELTMKQLGVKTQIIYDVGKFIENMALYDSLYLAKGWTLTKECRIARLTALLCGIEIVNDIEEEQGDE